MEIVNPVDPDDLLAWSATLRTTFLRPPDREETERSAGLWRGRLEPGRTWGARDDGRWVATLASDARRLTVPGTNGATNEAVVDALTAVTVNATHRRRGLLSSMLGASLRAAKERGDAMSYLIAAEWPIYGRFGYAPATRDAQYTYSPRSRGGALTSGPGRVRMVDGAEWAAAAPAAHARARRLRAGEIDRRPAQWTRVLVEESAEAKRNLVLHEGADGVDGGLAWEPARDFELGTGLGAIRVADLFAATPEAYRNLWAYLGGIDVVDEIRAEGRPVDEQIRWLLPDGRALRQTYAGDVTWLALLDVPAALTARGYDVEGSLVLEVVDPSTHGYAAGRYTLDAGPDGASCTPTTREPDVTLSAHALASAYLGGYRLAERALIGDVEEHRGGTVRLLDLMLSTPLAPYCGTGF